MNAINMDFSIFLTVVSFIITGLLGIIIYFIRSFIGSTEKLKCSVDDLKILVNTTQIHLSEFKSNYVLAHSEVVATVKNHADRITDHEERINTIEIKHKINHKE